MKFPQTTRAPRQIPLALRLDDEATFSNFIAGEANAALLSHLSQDCFDDLERFLWIAGGKGSGRTHLLQALCHRAADIPLTCAYIPLESYAELHPGILEGLDAMDLVCLDDADTVAGMPAWENALFNLYNQLTESGCRLVIAAAQTPVATHWQLPDLASRMQAGLVYPLRALDDEGKLLALRARARSRGFELPQEVASYLLMHVDRDLSNLVGVLQKLDELSLEKKRRITVPLLKELL
jgi:DnaA-homolog protein